MFGISDGITFFGGNRTCAPLSTMTSTMSSYKVFSAEKDNTSSGYKEGRSRSKMGIISGDYVVEVLARVLIRVLQLPWVCNV